MLINLRGTMDGNVIVFDHLPYYFCQGKTVSVNEVMIQWKSSRSEFVGALTSSLIERTACNQCQQLLLIPQEYPGRILFYSPTVRQVYRTQLSELSNSVFEIDTFGKPLPKIDRVYIQLQIEDSYLS